MQIEITGRHKEINDALRNHVEERFDKIAKQISNLARLEIVVSEERNPKIANSQIADANLHLKGEILHAKDSSPDLLQSINTCSQQLERQVERYLGKRRRNRDRQSISQLQTVITPETP